MSTERSEPLGSTTVCQIGFIVRDIEASIAAYADLLGVEPPGWSLTDPEETAHTRYHGQPSTARAKLAFFEPVGAPSTWREFLETHGEGVHHIAFTIQGMEEQLALLERKGMSTVQRGDYTGGRYAYVDATPQLHVILELLENFGR